MKVLFLSNVPSPYMVDFFNEFGKFCELTVIFEKRTSNERDASWEKFKFLNFKGIILNGLNFSVDSALSFGTLQYINDKSYDHIIVSNPTTPTGIVSIFYMKIKKIKYILESEGGFAKNGKGIKENFKKSIMSNAFMYLSTTPKADEYFLKYGAVQEKIRKYPFTSIYKNEIMDTNLTREKKEVIRTKIGLPKNKIAIAVGRFVKLKHFDVLIRSWSRISEDYFLYLIGSGPELDNYRSLICELKLKNIVILDFMDKSSLFNYYKASDLLIHPTSTDVWGLVINEAMACGLPVITTDMCIAGLELIENYENGFVIPVDDVETLVNKINYILESDEVIETMSMNNIKRIHAFTFEEMASVHMNILESIDPKVNEKTKVGEKCKKY